MTRRTALIVPVPESEPFVAALRREHDWSAAHGVPAHITVLFPFAPSDLVDEAAVAETIATHDAFDFALTSVEHFDNGLTWLRPTPAEPFSALTRAFARRFPDYPPYEGVHDEVIPHLTVAETRIELDIPLPLTARAHEVVLIEEEAPAGRWVSRARFALRSAG
jgi:2'-5' RNA ligase